MKGEPLITVHGLQGVVDRGDACPSRFAGDPYHPRSSCELRPLLK